MKGVRLVDIGFGVGEPCVGNSEAMRGASSFFFDRVRTTNYDRGESRVASRLAFARLLEPNAFYIITV